MSVEVDMSVTSIAPGSIVTIRNHRITGKSRTQKQRIMVYMRAQCFASRRQISKATGIELGAVAGRVNSLVKDGQLHIIEPMRRCPVSGQLVTFLTVPIPQGGLF